MRTTIAILFIVLLAAGAIAADVGAFGGYGGQSGRARRAEDPYSREQYFGEGYGRDFFNYGSKGPTYRMTNTGRKSMNSGSFNLDTNSFTPQGRNPGKISNWDPNIRGYSRLDLPVTLLPVDQFELQGNLVAAKGTARIVSLGDAYGSGNNNAGPNTQIFVTAVNMPPLDENQVYQVWLVDEDTGYPLSIGLFQPSAKTTLSLYFQFSRKVTPFDYMMVTQEDYPDIDPSPGKMVLWGEIGPTRTNVNPSTSYVNQRVR